MGFLEEIQWRGLLHQATDLEGLRAHLAGGSRRAYAGFDPSADSLTIGNLVPIMMLAHFQRAGHVPMVVMGGGTGLIGDPSGKSAERMLLTAEAVAENVRRQRVVFERVLEFGGPRAARIVNNADWLGPLGYIDVLRDVGKHFSVNMMIQKDSVRERLHARDQGISYTEFSYMILQAYDFLHLHRSEGVTIQMGGSDQYGNIVAGCDLIRRASARESDGERCFGVTAPLVTKADGGKFGKTESGAIWLTRERTSPYAFYQFWVNASDEDVGRFLRLFTFLTREEIEALEREHASDPSARAAQRRLAREATTIVHGGGAADEAEAATRALFSGDVASLSAELLAEVFAGVPTSEHERALLGGDGLDLVELLPATTLAKSKREAREFLASGSIALNGRRVGPDDRARASDLLHGGTIALRRGKKSWHITRWR